MGFNGVDRLAERLRLGRSGAFRKEGELGATCTLFFFFF